jgi:hypothetical protein
VHADDGKYISIVNRVALRKKHRLEVSSASETCHRGDLPAEDLIAEDIADGSPLPDRDVEVIAVACDLSLVELATALTSDSKCPASP